MSGEHQLVSTVSACLCPDLDKKSARLAFPNQEWLQIITKGASAGRSYETNKKQKNFDQGRKKKAVVGPGGYLHCSNATVAVCHLQSSKRNDAIDQ